MRKLLFYVLVVLFSFSFFPQRAFADSNFTTDFNVTYTISSNANTQVSIDISLTNLTTNYYASAYSVDVGFQDIKNVRARDSDGAIVPKVTKSDTGSKIDLNFNKRSVGYRVKQNFNLSFDTSEVAQKYGNVWDINIPGISNQSDFSSFNASVIYPEYLGNPAFIKPSPVGSNVQSGNKLTFTKNDLGASGISISFGSFQIYDFNLKYNLENTNVFPISTEIALPPTTNYQDVLIEDINPKPINVTIDKDGNWLAKFIIQPKKKLNVIAKGKAKINLYPNQQALDKNQLHDYLKSEPYWEVDNPKISELAKTLKTPYAIYQYVVKTLNYDFSRVESNSPRLGALQALNNPNSAVCLEFTDLFIALSRAAGIPAREIEGYGYTSNSRERPLSLVEDVLHAWPEYYDFDKKTWIMVDPTWGNTTDGIDYFNILDFDHFTFIIKGEKSNYPIPAGGYKLTGDKDTKDVNVQIASAYQDETPKVNAIIELPDTLFAGLPIQGNIAVSNVGQSLVKRQDISLTTNYLLPNNQTFSSEDIPPYGYSSISFSFDRTPILTNKDDTVKIKLGNTTSYKNVRILPFFVNKLFILGGIVFVIVSIIISLTAYLTRRLSLLRKRREDNLRGESQQP